MLNYKYLSCKRKKLTEGDTYFFLFSFDFFFHLRKYNMREKKKNCQIFNNNNNNKWFLFEFDLKEKGHPSFTINLKCFLKSEIQGK